MPGPVSDSYDCEFGTSVNAAIVSDAMTVIRDKIAAELGNKLRQIVVVCEDKCSPMSKTKFSERELRIIRFSINRALESM